MNEQSTGQFFGAVMPMLDERQRRLLAAAFARFLGRGGPTLVNKVTGISRVTINKGLKELDGAPCDPKARTKKEELPPVRKEGGGRTPIREKHPELVEELLRQLDGNIIGNPENPLCWTTKSTYTLAALLEEAGYKISPRTISMLLKEEGFSLQLNQKFVEKAKDSEDRDPQFRFINDLSKEFLAEGSPVISVDTKKKELIGNYKNAGAEWRPKGDPRLVNGHDFIGELGRATPYGIYDVGANEGFVSVGISADTAEFAVNSIYEWWKSMGEERYRDAPRLLITADGGGSNSSRCRLWKVKLQELANKIGREVYVCHFPPGTSKWNKIEHRMFAQISRNWRGRPLETLEIIIGLIASTTTKTGLKVNCKPDLREYLTKIKVNDEEMGELNLVRHEWHGEWNYKVLPQAARDARG